MTQSSLAATIVVAAYNEVETIAACVSSLLAMRVPIGPVEIIVVDNVSTDGTCDALAAFGDRIRVLTETTRGAAAARNCGIRAAQGPIVAFTDADCVVEPHWLSHLISPLADPTIGVVGGRILSLPGANRIARFGEVIHDHHDAIEVQEEPYVISMNWASRREVLLEAGLFDEALLRGQDVDLSWRIRQAGYRLVYSPNAVLRHHNQHTVWGLAHEGYVHAEHGLRVGRKHGIVFDAQGGWTRTRQRLTAGVSQLALGPQRIDGVLGLVFNAGKTAAEFAALIRNSRSGQ
jgi:GT2 family glycosyltransferase